MREELKDKLSTLPAAPGVYLMKDASGTVFYVGKAKSLRDRVRSYFSGSDTRAFVASLEDVLADLEVVLTHTEKEALLLENDLIKRHRPRCNVRLVDDKNYLCLKLDTRQTYPRLQVVRRFAKDGSKYFGPYHSASSIRETLRLINRHFQLRTCSDHVLANRKKPCLQYQIKRCPAPCVYDLSHGEYAQNITSVTAFLEGRQDELVASLERRMKEKAAALQFEAAASLRDQLHAVQRSLERQRVVARDFIDRDVVGYYREGPAIEIHVMRTRGGRLTDAKRYSLADMEQPTGEVLSEFASRYYAATSSPGALHTPDTDHDSVPTSHDLPDEILFPEDLEWAEPLSGLLSDKLGRTVRIIVPKRGDKRRLVDLAMRNAHQAFLDKRRQEGAARTAIERLARALRLKRLPERIECFDISHFQGSHIVASAVRFENGAPRKDLYRHYKIRSTQGQDDFQSMYEVLSRRARRGVEDGDLPDLIVIDGGKGQLNAARAALNDHGVDGVDLISLAKSRLLATDANPTPPTAPDTPEPEIAAPLAPLEAPLAAEAREATEAYTESELSRSPERVFVVGQKNPIVLRQNSAELFLLTRARDEAHRFAITFQRKAQSKSSTRSVLDSISGIGPKRRRALLKRFGSVTRLKAASLEEIAAVIGSAAAKNVIAILRPDIPNGQNGTPPFFG